MLWMLLGAVTLSVGLRRQRPDLLRLGRTYTWVMLGAAVVAFAIMERALITRDFTVAYVAEHGSSRTPALFNFATLWSALEGSIILWVLVLYVTMVYGPIAAMLVEMFPTRIRYTSMSLPYHIGNGWFGGFLPTTAFAIVAARGDIYSGLWYPVIVALLTFAVGIFYVKETKDVDL